ncbi:MAG: hypothetical protein ABSC51_00735 [Gaiellaceae bacterium]|jgi:hypothetical protein
MPLEPVVRKLVLTVAAATAIFLVTIATGCSAGCSVSVSIGHKKTGGTYHDHGVSFKIPKGWSRLARLTTQTKAGNEIWTAGFAPRSGSDLVAVTAYATNVTVTGANVARYAQPIAAELCNLVTSTGGTVLSGPTLTSAGGMPGYRFQTTLRGNSGEKLKSWMILIWNGRTEYFFNCQHEAQSSSATEIERGCTTITNSFRLAG